MINLKNKPLLISTISLILTIILCMAYKNLLKTSILSGDSESASKLAVNSQVNTSNTEMRAIWVPFMSLNMANTDYSKKAFTEKFDNIISESKRHNLNTLIVHVRPFNDALYPSDYVPWSHIISGQQGKNPGFDPLDYMISATHKAGMQFHAWINPMRIQINNTPSSLSESNIINTIKNDQSNPKDMIITTETGKYLNPAYPQIRKFIIDGVSEIVKKYPIDGIQFDDYFYPPNTNEADKPCYDDYCSSPGNLSPIPITQWRLANINALISGTYSAIKNIKSDVVFGVSPQCNTDNDLKVGADVFTWCRSQGYIDYICPQTYISLEHPVLPFAKSINQWKELVKDSNIKLYFGLAMYKAGSDKDYGTWKNHNDILKKEVEQCRQLGCNGFMLFSFEDFKNEKAAAEIQNVMSVLD